MALLFDENEQGNLHRKKKYKMKQLMCEISPIDLTRLMKSTLKRKEEQLQKQIEFWQSDDSKLKNGGDLLKENEKYNFLTKLINILVAILLFSVVFYMTEIQKRKGTTRR